MVVASKFSLTAACLLALQASVIVTPRAAAAQFLGSTGKNPEALDEALKATGRLGAAEREIRRKWDSLGGSPGEPRVPGEAGLIAIGDGFYREYSKAGDRIYYRPGTPPLFIYGAIGDKFIKAGGPTGWLGWPTAEEQAFPEDGRAVSFQNGGIYYWPDTGAIEFGNVIVRYAGLFAFGETDNDSGSAFDLTGEIRDGDEPYFVFSVLGGQTPAPILTKTQVYTKVRPKNARPDNLEIYRGPPFGAGITAVLFEEDFGDASKMRDKVEQGVEAAHHAGAGAAIAIPVVGVAVAAALEAGWAEYGEDVKNFLADRLGLEDDNLDTKSVFISAKQMIVMSQKPRNEEHGIGWHVNTKFSGEGGSWMAYFNLEAEPHAASATAPVTQPRTLEIAQSLWSTRQDIARTQWDFADANTVGWAQAERAATEICAARGFAAGHFTGHQDLAKGDFGLLCLGEGTTWRDVSAQEIAATNWSFTEVDKVNWAQAGRAAERLCAAANGGFAGGQFNGHQIDGKYGLYCYGNGSRWFDASGAELAATGFGFATPRLDDVPWAQAMRAAYGFCQKKGFAAGFMNGHQAPDKYGLVCQGSNGAKPLGRLQVPTGSAPQKSLCEAAASARARGSPAAPGLERQCELSKAPR